MRAPLITIKHICQVERWMNSPFRAFYWANLAQFCTFAFSTGRYCFQRSRRPRTVADSWSTSRNQRTLLHLDGGFLSMFLLRRNHLIPRSFLWIKSQRFELAGLLYLCLSKLTSLRWSNEILLSLDSADLSWGMRLWSRSDFDPRTDSFGGGEDGLLFGDFCEDVVVEDSEEDVEICVLSSC